MALTALSAVPAPSAAAAPALPTFDKLKFMLAPNRTHIEVGVK